ncbi:hypothetical protein ED733_006744 [Metarhizium rileyi]|uniref:Transcription factor domain-containing protein n=1 Tax=Metarhizium rileyi (strain RCEF 4871) TaxID=1649241 RepID=A0A5C6GES2_METRR|nr:hypothetical protein ED733_006744 [Metarhizium rileyi]
MVKEPPSTVVFYDPLEPGDVKDRDEPKLSNVSNADIQARLDRLETWITGLAGPSPGSGSGSTPLTAVTDARSVLLTSPSSLPHLQPLSPPLSSTVQRLSEDALWFGGNFICKTAKGFSSDTGFLDAVATYHLSPIRLIKKPYSIIHDATSAFASSGTGSREICLTLPLYQEACIILHNFTQECPILCPAFHIPSVFPTIQSIYASVQQQTPVDKSQLLLFLAIIASVTYSSSYGGNACRLFSSHLEASAQCASWVTASYALSDEIKRRGQMSIVCLQAQNILYKVSTYIEGSSVRTRSLIFASIAMAHQMGFHRMDLPGNKSGNSGLESKLEREIGRRLWWDLVSIDWLFALFPGSSEGVYTIHPQHMVVNKPSLIRDSDDATPASPQEMEQQSEVAYLLERIRLTEISREYIDRCPLANTNTDANYEEVLRHDTRLGQYQQELPPFFSVDRLSAPAAHENPTLIVHRIQINCMLYVLRCFLHLRYLSHSTVDPKYAPSRTSCFTCAIEIVRLHREVKSRYPWIMPRLKATSFLRSLIMAGAVFLLDVCSGREIWDFKRERAVMLDAWRLMGEQQEDSNLVEQFFEFASQMLKKYGVSETIVADLLAQRPQGSENGHVPEQIEGFSKAYLNGCDERLGVEAMNMDQRWQTLNADFDLKTMSWDNVLWGFDAILM